MPHTGFINGTHVYLRKLTMDDVNDTYLSWLNDPDVLRYRGPKAYPSNTADLKAFVEFAQGAKDLYLAVCLKKDGRHIGGISLTSVNFIHGTAELNIMIGDKREWGKGYGADAIAALTRHAFLNMRLRKLWCESPNPSFNKVVGRQGWVHEGTKRALFLLDGAYADVECYGLLEAEHRARETRA